MIAMDIIRNYNDFVEVLLRAGFSMSYGNAEGVFCLMPWNWNDPPPYDTPVRYHTGDPDTDPWAWRIRVLTERDDIAYGKLFFKKSGYITREWYPYFLAARRGGMEFAEAYESGTISYAAKRIYDAVSAHGTLPLPAIKKIGGFAPSDKSAFDSALTELQMKMYLTICGEHEEVNWPSNVLCTTEHFFGIDVFEEAASIPPEQAVEKIRERILELNPAAAEKRINKFIRG